MKFLIAKKTTKKDKFFSKVSAGFSKVGRSTGLSKIGPYASDKKDELAKKIYTASENGYLPKMIYERHHGNKLRRENKVYYKDSLNHFTVEIATFYDLDNYFDYAIFSTLLFKQSFECYSKEKMVNNKMIDNKYILNELIIISGNLGETERYFYTAINSEDIMDEIALKKEDIFNFEKIFNPSTKYVIYFNKLYKAVYEFLSQADETPKNVYFENMNAFVIKHTSGKNKREFANYLFTPTDGEKFRLLGSWVFALTGVALTLVFLPPLGAASLVALAIAGPILTLALYVGPKIKDVLFRKRQNYYIDEKKFKERLSNVEYSEKKFKEMKELILNFKRLISQMDMYNFYFSNAFDYYCKLKKIIDLQLNDVIKNKPLEDKQYGSIKVEIEFNYYKLLGYFRLKKGLQANIKIQLEGLKEICLKNIYLLRNDADFKSYISIHKSSLANHMNKFVNKIRKKNKMPSEVTDSLEQYLLQSLITDEFLSAKEKRDLEPKMKELNAEFEAILTRDSKLSFEILNRSEEYLQSSPASFALGLEGKVQQKMSPSAHYVDPGLFLIASSIESMLFLSASSSLGLLESHKRVFSILRKISGLFTGLKLGTSIFMLVARKVGWIDLFTTGMQHIYVNPFQVILGLISVSVETIIDKHYIRYWDKMYNSFKTYLKDQNGENAKYPVYTYFSKEFGNSQMSAITKMSNVFRDKFLKISGLLDEINSSSKHLCKNVQNNMTSKKKGSGEKYDKENDKAYEIFEKYAEITLKILSVSHEIKELDFYVQCIYSFDPEIEKVLKINSTLLFMENKEVFALNYFQNDQDVENKCSG
jgi:hypothetical protein